MNNGNIIDACLRMPAKQEAGSRVTRFSSPVSRRPLRLLALQVLPLSVFFHSAASSVISSWTLPILQLPTIVRSEFLLLRPPTQSDWT
jgi:hypothetical protein